MHDRRGLKRTTLAAGDYRTAVIVNLVPFLQSSAGSAHGFEIYHDGGESGTPLRVRDVLAYPGCPDWGTWRFARHLADLSNREHLYSVRNSSIFDAGSAARRILDLAARDGYDALTFLSERPRPAKELRWAWAVPPTSLSSARREGDAEPGPLRIPRFPYEISGLRDAAGRLMFSEDSRALVSELDAWLVEMDADPLASYQKWSAEGPWAFALPIGGEWCPCKLKSSEGRIEINLPSSIAPRLAGLIDDQDPREGRNGSRKLVYEWTPGQSATGFIGKLQAEMDRAYDLLSRNPAEMN